MTMEHGKKEVTALTVTALAVGGLATGCAGEAGAQDGQPTEVASPTASASWDPTNPNSLPPSSISISPDGTVVYTPPAEITSKKTSQSQEECDGQPKPIIPIPHPDVLDEPAQDINIYMQQAQPNPITDRNKLMFTVVCLHNGTPPWDLKLTDGTNLSTSLSWGAWGKYIGNTTYGQ